MSDASEKVKQDATKRMAEMAIAPMRTGTQQKTLAAGMS